MTVATTVANHTETSDQEIIQALAADPWNVTFYFPGSYKPLSYRAGEVCERCWLGQRFVCGIGKDGCNHK